VNWVKSSHCQTSECLEWRTSSYSMNHGDCVEVAPAALVRDSQLGDGSPVLRFTPHAWGQFTTKIKGEGNDLEW